MNVRDSQVAGTVSNWLAVIAIVAVIAAIVMHFWNEGTAKERDRLVEAYVAIKRIEARTTCGGGRFPSGKEAACQKGMAQQALEDAQSIAAGHKRIREDQQ